MSRVWQAVIVVLVASWVASVAIPARAETLTSTGGGGIVGASATGYLGFGQSPRSKTLACGGPLCGTPAPAEKEIIVLEAGTLRWLVVSVLSQQPASGALTLVVLRNDQESALGVLVPPGGGGGSYTEFASSEPVQIGDHLVIRVSNWATESSAQIGAVSVRFDRE